MSLLDDVSIVVTPNGYKAGELYAVVPVPTEGSEMLSQPVDLQTDFTAVNGASIVDANTFTTTGGSVEGLTKAAILTVGTQYKLIIEGTTTSSGFSLGNTTAGGNEYGSGFGTHYFTASGNNTLWLRQSTAGTTDITSFSIKEYTSADMDVTRATAATRVDEDGLVNYAEIIGGEEIEDGDFPSGTTAWIFGAGWSLGTNKAERLVAASSTDIVQASVFPNLTSTFKISFDVVRSAGSVRLRAGTYSLPYVGATDTYIYYVTPVSNNQLKFQADSSFVGSISNVSVKEITRDNVPRIDYTGGGCPHILAEPQRTNELTQSNDFANAYWSKSSSAIDTSIGTDGIQSNISTSPDGTINADRVNFLLQSDKDIGLAKSIGSSAGVTHSFSGYLKGEGSNIGKDVIIRVKRSSGGSYVAVNKTITLTAIWQRVELDPLTLVTDNTGARIILSSNDATNCLVYGFQIEQGSYATSYIPTSGSTVTRNQDIFTRDGIGSLINSTEGVLFIEMAALSDDGTDRRITITDGTVNNAINIGLSRFSGNINAEIHSGGSLQTSGWGATGITQINNNKFALSWGSGTMKFYVNGSSTSSLTGITSPIGLNNLKFSAGDDTLNFFGKVKQLQVYNTALTDEQLLQLTGTSGTDFYESYAEMASALTYTIQ
jgi:hypothetical protein